MSKSPKAKNTIVGRDAFIADAWKKLADKSLYMNDLRRIGKTQIILKMRNELPDGWVAVFSDLEGTHTAEEFAASVYKDSAAILTKGSRGLRKMAGILGKAAGVEILGILKLPDGQVIPWKDVLRNTFEDVVEALEPGQRMVFFWDEVPYLLENIANRQGKQTAMEVFDILRELAQRHDTVRLVLTGSIGIHHVLQSLWGDGYKGSPLNHMDLIQPGPLSPEDAAAFATSELTRRGLLCGNELATCGRSLAELASHVPFYIEKLAGRLPRGELLTPALIALELDAELRSVNNDWDLEYYSRRVKSVFGDHEKLVLAILDALAIAENQSLSFAEINNAVSSRIPTDAEALREQLRLLCKDHYLAKRDSNQYRFYLTLIRRWWKLDRDL